jgi:hypothetical protein
LNDLLNGFLLTSQVIRFASFAHQHSIVAIQNHIDGFDATFTVALDLSDRH